MTQQDKNIIKLKNIINYYEYKIESNIKFIEYLVNCNEVYTKIIENEKRDLKKNEEIEVLKE